MVLSVVLLAAAIGCGDGMPKRVPIAGTVTLNGKPLERGFVQVVPKSGPAATGEIGPGGKFRLTTINDNDGCILGTHEVAIIANESQGPNAMKWYAPKHYADASTSGLTLAVSEPKDNVTFELTSQSDEPEIERFENEGTMPPVGAEEAKK